MEGDQLAAWLRARAGKLTASRMGDAMAFKKPTKAGAIPEPREERSKLMRELLAERITGDSVRHFVNDAMQWGLEKESEAKEAYEAHAGLFITEAGFYDHPRIDNLGATPDGLLAHDGLIETKCPTTATFAEWVLAGVVPEKHKPQMIVQMACTGRAWCEFVAYDPRIRDPRRQLFVRRYTPTPEEIAKVEAAAEQFLRELDTMFELFTTAAA